MNNTKPKEVKDLEQHKPGHYLGPLKPHFHAPGQRVSAQLCKKSDPTDCMMYYYDINSMGFRGPEFNPEADFTIVISGDSNTYGLGISWNKTWGALLLEKFKQDQPSKTFSLLNTASPGAPNDYTSRTLIDCVSTYKANLAIGVFSFMDRKEHLVDDQVLQLGPWQEHEISLRYYDYYSELDGFVNTMKNILLFQWHCETTNTPYFLCWMCGWKLNDEQFKEHPVCSRYMSLINFDKFCPCPLVREDRAYDEMHSGEIGNSKQAELFYEAYNKAYRDAAGKGEI